MWAKFWTEEARKIEEKTETPQNRRLIQPFIDGNKYKSENNVLINTHLASYLIIIIFMLVYSLFFLYRITSAHNDATLRMISIEVCK